MRAHRDWLYGNLRAWEPTLAGWDRAGAVWDEAIWDEAARALLGRTHRFLAPRHMPVQEWQRAAQGPAKSAKRAPDTKQMVW